MSFAFFEMIEGPILLGDTDLLMDPLEKESILTHSGGGNYCRSELTGSQVQKVGSNLLWSCALLSRWVSVPRRGFSKAH